MNDQDGVDKADYAMDQAIEWLVRIQSDHATDADRAGLVQWLAASEANRDAFDMAEHLDAEISDSATFIRAALDRPAGASIPFRPRPVRTSRWFVPAALAAGIAAAIFIAPLSWRAAQRQSLVYQTAPGETRVVVLADGTRVRLNAASRIAVRFGWFSRRIDLGDGEAAFDVARDPRRPFIVNVGDQEVRDVGTEFNVRHYDHTILITVRHGIVDVDQPARGDQPIARLTAGEELRHAEGSSQSSIADVNADAAFAWTQGRLVCDDQPLSEIVAYLNRRYSIPIRVSDAASQRRFSGVLELDDETTVVRNLATYLSLSVVRSGRTITLR